MTRMETPAGRVHYTADTYTTDPARTRREVLAAGGRVLSSSPVGGGYIIRAAYPIYGADILARIMRGAA